MTSVLVLSPHTDDAELSCGGTILKYLRRGHLVTVVVFSNCENSLIENNMDPCTLRLENMKALEHIGVKQENVIYLAMENRKLFEKRADILDFLHKWSKKRAADVVLIPQPNDVHQDHQTVAEEAIRAFRRTNATILGYEIVGTSGFDPNYFVPINEAQLNRKLQALEFYQSQKILRPYFRPEIVRSMAEMRGAAVKEQYAEAFVLIKGKFDVI